MQAGKAQKISKPKKLADQLLQVILRILRDLALVIAGATVGIAFQGVGIRDTQSWLVLIVVILLITALADLWLARMKTGNQIFDSPNRQTAT